MERGGIGDILIRLPYYNYLYKSGIELRILLPKDKYPVLSMFLPAKTLGVINQGLLAYSPCYSFYLKMKYNISDKDSLYIPITYNHKKILDAAKRLKMSTFIYEGEAVTCDLASYGFNIIAGIDEANNVFHVSRHVDRYFRSLFSGLPPYEELFLKYPEMLRDAKHRTHYDLAIMTDAGAKYRCYPAELWQKFLNMLPSKLRIVQVGNDSLSLNHPNLTKVRGANIYELFSIIKDTPLFIGNETGFTHWAYLCGNHALCILGGGDRNRFLPWNIEKMHVISIFDRNCICRGWRCHKCQLSNVAAPCILSITPEEIYQGFLQMSEEL